MPISLIDTLARTPIAVVDLETTGASAQWGDRAIEVGIVRIESGQIVSRYQQLIDPQRYVSPGITALTGISQAMVTGQPRFHEIVQDIIPLLRDAVILGHNVRFDLSFLRKEFRATGREMADAVGRAHVLDTVRIARRRFGRGGNGLANLSRRLGVVQTTAHRALADAETTAAVFEKMIEPIGHWNCVLCDVIAQQGGPMGLEPVNSRESELPLELEEALEMHLPVLMEYLDAGDRRTERVIEPLRIRRFKGETLLVAHCQLRNDQRTFKLDRIVQLKRMGQDVSSGDQPCSAPVPDSLF